MAKEKINTIMVRPNGPLIATGDIEVLDEQGNLLATGDNLALCRCGASRNKPFCDGMHSEAGFEDDSHFEDPRSEAPEGEGKLVIQCRENAMLVANGPMQIISRDETCHSTRNKAALCRCGHSEKKPFCDARHKKCNFKSSQV